MVMPTFVQNIMEGREAKSIAVWLVAVRQLNAKLQQMNLPTTKWSNAVVGDLLDCCEAFARLEINAINHHFECDENPDWQDLADTHDNVSASALGFDEKFLSKEKLRLEEKGLV